ncbi:receptor-like protein 7 [Juglans microcarpa x Juglans regia]|uniref:receptor-like protein 7 n=1 Tax=Juglans microcarpa x Juglans regia TaxID=2249226 RepID=UPI001B7EE0D6|nr:receptor-like protein 7 [Juglans microcarpa x Juglans regia]
MGLSFPLIILIVRFLVSLMMFYLILSTSSSGVQPLCHDDERFALLQFKESFIINQFASGDPSAYPKVSSWKPESRDCCNWDGVECNKDTGHVIGLNLSSSCLKGFLNSNSSLFRLAHLQNLKLDDNDFNSSPLPTSFRQLSRLTNLNLSASAFSGQIPSEILELSKLVFLDLSDNPLLKLQKSGLRVIAQNFTNLEVLHLDYVVIPSNVPNILANLTSLTSLSLIWCDLLGEFPVGIFHLPNLQLLRIGGNEYLTGYVPELNRTSPLVTLRLGSTNFYGELPDSIGHLKSLVMLTAWFCNFSGEIPPSLGNLTNLIELQLQFNSLHGSIPQSISRLVNLEVLCLHSNYLSGRVEIELFLRLKYLSVLALSNNNISLLTKPSTNSTVPKFWGLALGYCDLDEFPEFLRSQDRLEHLDLSENKINGPVPNWMGNISIETLGYLNLELNSLTGFDQLPANLEVLRLGFNMLQGSLPIPPSSIVSYSVSNNRLIGEIPHWICNRSLITKLDLSSNNLGGILPQCLGNLSDSLTIVDLHDNSFHGTIPRICGEANKLMMIDLSQNHLQGRVPRSLANCIKLKAINLGSNQIHDIFPSWLGILPELRILILRSNELYGTIGSSDSNFDFPKLHIIDLSNNDFTGTLPSEHFQNWKAMQIVDDEQLQYMEEEKIVPSFARVIDIYSLSMTMINKGTEMVYGKVSNLFIAIDLSRNRFEGEIPGVVGHLKGLNLLNLSHNFLTGPIPFVLANLTGLESLDLSQNKLSGVIPPQLIELTFLSHFNVSHNRLTGPIPQGKQFDTFENSSFSENLELCGSPLSKKCGNPEDSLPPSSSHNSTNHNSKFSFEFGWKVVALGYGCGFVFGAVSGQIMITKKYGWFMKTFAIGQRGRRDNWRGRRN